MSGEGGGAPGSPVRKWWRLLCSTFHASGSIQSSQSIARRWTDPSAKPGSGAGRRVEWGLQSASGGEAAESGRGGVRGGGEEEGEAKKGAAKGEAEGEAKGEAEGEVAVEVAEERRSRGVHRAR